MERLYGKLPQGKTILSGVDTEGLTKAQKKKLKTKLKKQMGITPGKGQDRDKAHDDSDQDDSLNKVTA